MTRLELPTTATIFRRVVVALALGLAVWTPRAVAESQNGEYRGINDPFGDPSNYEFADDEREDKEFFHLGRFLMMGVDFGLGVFTGGLGGTVNPAPAFGGHFIYFFDKSLGLELAGSFETHLDQIPIAGGSVDSNLSMAVLSLGFRYYFDTKDAPKAIAVANPYLVLAPGIYFKSVEVLNAAGGSPPDVGDENGFGVAAGGGVEFNVYRRHIYLGLDMRYHLVFFPSEGAQVTVNPNASRAGDYFRASATINYNF